MPLEIKELIVKINVQNDQASSTNSEENIPSNGVQNQEALIQLCVEKVLEILQEKAER